MSQFPLSRRSFLHALGAGALLSMASPMYLARASAVGDKKLIVIILRGGMDGLAAMVPYADTDYKNARGALALDPKKDGLLALDHFFALHPALAGIHSLYQDKQALFMHAAATPYRSRSHFDGQDVLENGMASKLDSRDGWLNRTLAVLSPNHSAIAISAGIPLILQGNTPVQSWSASSIPEVNDAFYQRLASMYESDERFHTALMQGIAANDIVQMDEAKTNKRSSIHQAEAAAKFLLEPKGPNIAVMGMAGWDTHANQGLKNGVLANRFTELDNVVISFKKTLADEWKNTAILIATEFGRTVMANGTAGSDHGTGSIAMLLGGAVEGGRIVGQWPGLAKNKLYEERDLYPANDIRSLFAGTLQGLYGIDTATLSQQIFPNATGVTPIKDLIRQL